MPNRFQCASSEIVAEVCDLGPSRGPNRFQCGSSEIVAEVCDLGPSRGPNRFQCASNEIVAEVCDLGPSRGPNRFQCTSSEIVAEVCDLGPSRGPNRFQCTSSEIVAEVCDLGPSTAGLREASHKRTAIAGVSEPNHTVNCEMDHLAFSFCLVDARWHDTPGGREKTIGSERGRTRGYQSSLARSGRLAGAPAAVAPVGLAPSPQHRSEGHEAVSWVCSRIWSSPISPTPNSRR